MPKKKIPRTYFEQVPIKIVKKIAKLEPPDDEDDENGTTIKRPAKN